MPSWLLLWWLHHHCWHWLLVLPRWIRLLGWSQQSDQRDGALRAWLLLPCWVHFHAIDCLSSRNLQSIRGPVWGSPMPHLPTRILLFWRPSLAWWRVRCWVLLPIRSFYRHWHSLPRRDVQQQHRRKGPRRLFDLPTGKLLHISMCLASWVRRGYLRSSSRASVRPSFIGSCWLHGLRCRTLLPRNWNHWSNPVWSWILLSSWSRILHSLWNRLLLWWWDYNWRRHVEQPSLWSWLHVRHTNCWETLPWRGQPILLPKRILLRWNNYYCCLRTW